MRSLSQPAHPHGGPSAHAPLTLPSRAPARPLAIRPPCIDLLHPQESTSHGYDIVTNKGYFDKDPAPLPPARTVPKPTHWESLAASSNQFWHTRTLATQSRTPGLVRARPASEGAPVGGAGMGSARGGSAAPVVPALDMSRTRPALEMTAASSVRTGGFR
jgi:hypothetical protein